MLPYIPLFAQIFGPSTFTTNPSSLFKDVGSHCPASSPVSCQNTTAVDTCCLESPGGLLLQTQFWDTDVPGSPRNTWTIHGLWPDNCDGSYIENCDPSRDYNIRELLTEQGASSTLEYIKKYWLNANGDDEHLWNHEWSTHGTCYSTLEPSCLPDGSPEGAEAVSYVQTIVKLYQTLPTYKWLAEGGIKPSYDRTYHLDEILEALGKGYGYTPAVGCSRGNTLNSVSYYYNLKGSLLDGQFISIDSPKRSTCPHSHIRYLPREDDGEYEDDDE